MKLNAILSADRVASGVSVTSKKKALEELSRLLAKGTDKLSSTDIFNGLTAREKLNRTRSPAPLLSSAWESPLSVQLMPSSRLHAPMP